MVKEKQYVAIANLPQALLLKKSLTWEPKYVNLKSASFVIIMLLHKGLTHIHSQQKPKFHFGESFNLFACASRWNDSDRVSSLCFLSELYVLMRDQDDGVKELKLEQEKRVFNHCFTGNVLLVSLMTEVII